MKHLLAVALSGAALVISAPAHAQLAGDIIKGQTGLAAGTQPPESLVLSGWFYDYYSTQVVDGSGNVLPTTGSLNSLAVPGLNLWYVSPLTILGANYGAVLSLWGASPTTDFPRLNVNQSTYGFGDMYLQPVQLGWHTTYVDVITGVALWIPTGRYSLGANDNTGQGQWGFEPSLGATLWFDKGHHFNLSTQVYYDIYLPKRNATVQNTQVQTGNILTLEGGIGYQFLGGALNIGIPYTAQWKVTEDTLPQGIGIVLPGIQTAKDWSVGLGAEADLFWSATDGVTLRFLQTFAGANTSNGSTYFIFYNHIFYFGGK
ncbi:MAG: transporter [Myxococcaceae bacterium]